MENNILCGQGWTILYTDSKLFKEFIQLVEDEAEKYTVNKCGNILEAEKSFKNWYVFFDAYFSLLLHELNKTNFAGCLTYGIKELRTRDWCGVKLVNTKVKNSYLYKSY